MQRKTKIWLQAFRLRTLPLALANAVMGSMLALGHGAFRWPVFVLTLLTITFLQILSNLANDYGDAVSGKDTDRRVGPKRVTVSGMVSRTEMKRMIIVFVSLSVISGSLLIYFGLAGLDWDKILLFFGIGAAAIIAAIKYTVGRNPYGYKGFGDIFVFIFFGLVGVLGTYFLHTHWFEPRLLYPAAVIGLFSTGVLNINNLRDIETDKETGKNTLAVQYGLRFARRYHVLLIAVGWFLSVVFTFSSFYSGWQFIYLVTLPLFIRNILRIFSHKSPEELNNELKNLAMTTFLFASLFGIGMVL
ncbi:MAG TPA: 1,4-dihydroxy-2-naphthoate polyprenyltransferase [Prolixibacteraceae bacterium]|nr:1,4-dihydroxy-2-naphthoate polyprenyltransferase [Prolixibacteraceae bacterium]